MRPASLPALIRDACASVNRNLTQDEWDRFLGADQPYTRTCADLPSDLGAAPDAPATA
jgi:hypothetical protein